MLFSWCFVERVGGERIVDIDTLSEGYETVLVLGTSPYMYDGRGNLFYVYRIEAVEELVKSGKISHVLVSGDNGHKEYNEPQAMQESLVEL